MNNIAKKRLSKYQLEVKGLLQQMKGRVDFLLEDGEKIKLDDTRTLQNWLRSLTEMVAGISTIEQLDRLEKKK